MARLHHLLPQGDAGPRVVAGAGGEFETDAIGFVLVGSSPASKLITTGVILLLAVTLDTLSRRRLEASGR